MKTKRRALLTVFLTTGSFTLSLLFSGCMPGQLADRTLTPSPSPTATRISTATPTRTPSPTPATPAPEVQPDAGKSPPQTIWKDFITPDFRAVHSLVDEEASQYLIFGKLPVSPPAKDLDPALAAYLGRWEGVDTSLPGEQENKIVFVVQEITSQGGKAFLWAGYILQYPFFVKEVGFRVVPGETPSIEWEADLTGAPGGKGVKAVIRLTYDGEGEALRGGIQLPSSGEIVHSIKLGRTQTFYVYQDLYQYLASKRIRFKEFQNPELQRYGQGYLVHLPQGYEANLRQTWPLILFLIGTGERGDTVFLLTRHGPLRMILEKEPLPFIVVSPMLNVSAEFRSFPEKYLDGVMDEVLADYRVDRKRIYLTGLSMGGEATYRYALHQPDLFAAIAPLAGFDARYFPGAIEEGFEPFKLPLERIKDLPVWAVHGAEDEFVPLVSAQDTVEALEKAGGNVRFTVLEDHGHDVWTDLYLSSEFYQWLLQYEKP